PIISVLGHVDHGKTSLLDRIRRSNIAKREAGGITQMIGASYLSKESIISISGSFLKRWKFDVQIPGLLFIDTPGHEAFTLLREQGGSIADLAILVIDIKQGVQPQTVESINILRNYKTPFVIALTKVDTVSGWRKMSEDIQENISMQSSVAREEFESLVWRRIAELGENGINSDLFYNIRDFTRTAAIIPVSSVTGEGFSELIGLICGLSQRFLRSSLVVSPDEPVEGTIIDIKREVGGNYVDVIIYRGQLRRGDNIYSIDMSGNLRSIKVRGLFVPNISSNDPKERYRSIQNIAAAAGVRILTNTVEDLMIGFPISSRNQIDTKNINNIFRIGDKGVVVKTDSVGSADAFRRLAEKEGIVIRRIGIGNINKDDIEQAIAMNSIDPSYGFILGFNVNIGRDELEYANSHGVKVVLGDVIYRIIEAYRERVREKEQEIIENLMRRDVYPAKIYVMRDYIFRKSKPAIFGVRIIEGEIRTNTKLIDRQGNYIGEIIGIQRNREALSNAKKNDEVAIAVNGGEIDVNIFPDTYLYTEVNNIDNWKGIIPQELYQEYKSILILRKIREV
ncbi:MAG: translation initiation factor IF-2, partial [Candidatus Micrarchaeota archaeon]|nr:translation initiation factor IF-2 [Candidatus Micrarchaeota archaeon]